MVELAYTNTTIFETFSFPMLPNGKYDPRKVPPTPEARALAAAAERFEKERSAACKEHGLTEIHRMMRDGALPELRKSYDAMNDAVDACYGREVGTWREGKEVLKRMREMNRRVAMSGDANAKDTREP